MSTELEKPWENVDNFPRVQKRWRTNVSQTQTLGSSMFARFLFRFHSDTVKTVYHMSMQCRLQEHLIVPKRVPHFLRKARKSDLFFTCQLPPLRNRISCPYGGSLASTSRDEVDSKFDTGLAQVDRAKSRFSSSSLTSYNDTSVMSALQFTVPTSSPQSSCQRLRPAPVTRGQSLRLSAWGSGRERERACQTCY